jgi:hypothetical protein
MAKKRKFPKAPKASASLESWKRYEQRVDEVKKHNAQLERDAEAKKKLIEKVRTKRSRA